MNTLLGLSFSYVLHEMKDDLCVSRYGWPDRGDYLYILHERWEIRIANDQTDRDEVWTPTHDDLLSEDWYVREERDGRVV